MQCNPILQYSYNVVEGGEAQQASPQGTAHPERL